MPNLRSVVVPDSTLLGSQLSDFQQGTQTSALQRIQQRPGIAPAANAGDGDRNIARRCGFSPKHAAKWRPIAACCLPRMLLLRAHRLFADRIAIDTINGAWHFRPALQSNPVLREVGQCDGLGGCFRVHAQVQIKFYLLPSPNATSLASGILVTFDASSSIRPAPARACGISKFVSSING